MSAHYMRLPTSDSQEEVKIDFNSPFQYSSTSERYGTRSHNQYRSAFTFSGDQKYSNYTKDVQYQTGTVKQPLIGRICHMFLTGLCILLLMCTFPISLWFCFKRLGSDERIVIFRLGRLVATKGPGLVFILPCVDNYRKINLKIKAFNVPPQQIITYDRGIIEVGANVFHKVTDIEKSVLCVQDVNLSLRTLVSSALKNAFVKREVDDIQENRLIIVAKIQDDCNVTTGSWGIQVTNIEIPFIKVIQAPAPKNPLAGLGMGNDLPQTFQQLTALFLQNTQGSSKEETNPEQAAAPAPIPSYSSVMVVPPEGASGSVEGAPLPRDVIQFARGLINESAIRSIGSCYVFQLHGENGGLFYLDLKNGNGSAGEGLPPGGEPDVTLTLSVADMQNMFLGNTKPLQAYMSGRLKVSGDLSAALRLEDFVKKVVDKIKSDSQ